MTATTPSGPVDLMNGVAPDGTPMPPGGKPAYHKGIYCFLKRKDVDVPTLAPLTFLTALSFLEVLGPLPL
jgi:hypothetical protein